MKLLFTLAMALFANIAFANDYYFSSAGNDAHSTAQAQNPSTPWRTLEKLNNVFSTLQPGDKIFFKRGERFFGTLSISASGTSSNPILLSAYGTGANPVLTGFSQPSNWSATGNGVWEVLVTGANSNINSVVINGEMQPLGRYPNSNAANSGYLQYESYSGSTSITDQQLSGSPNWNGGEVVIRKTRWVLDRNTITQHSGSTITYNAETGYYGTNNYGYFIQNHPATLDQQGEWFYKGNEKRLGVYLGSGNPSGYVIEAATVETLISINNQHHIAFSNLTFTGSNANTFYIKEATGINIANCNLLYAGANAIYANNTNGLSIKDCLFDKTNNIAFNGDNCQNTILRSNTFTNTGMYAGMGKGNSGSYEAVLISGNNNLVEYNTIDNTGYIPVTFSGSSVTIKNNVITNFALVKDDGGGIYTWNNTASPLVNADRKIIGNIISKGRGAGNGTDNPAQAQVHGIYIDDNADHVTVAGNTVSECAANGIFIHNAHDITLNGNTAYNNTRQLLMEHDNIAANAPIRNITSFSNILFSKTASQAVAEYKTHRNDLTEFGNFDSNYYLRPINEQLVIGTLYQNNGSYYAPSYDLEGWRAAYGKDLHSFGSPQQIPSHTVTGVVGSNQYGNGAFNSNIGGLYAYASANNAVTSWSTGGGLDGGALKLSFNSVTSPSNKASVIIAAGGVTSGKTYLLKFSMKGGAENKNIEAYLRKSLSGYNDLTERKGASIKGTRTEHEFLFTANVTESDASIVFDVPEQSSALYLDNIELYEVNATATNADDHIRFEVNTGSSIKTITLDGTYVDARNTTYPGAIILAPYTSAVLIKKNGQAPPSGNVPPIAVAGSDVTITLPVAAVTLAGSGTDVDGTIAGYSWTKVSGPAQYSMADSGIAAPVVANLLAGTYNFRLTVTDNKGATHSDDVNVLVMEAAPMVSMVPGRIEAENYNQMTGVLLESTTDTGGGKNVGWIDGNDWMEYNINAITAGTYTINLRVAAANAGATLRILNTDAGTLANVSVPNTGGYQTWQTVSSVITLLQGVQKLKIVSVAGTNWNFNWMDLALYAGPVNPGSAKIEAEDWSLMSGVLQEITTDAGGGQNVGWIDNGDWMEYSLTAATAGTYTLKLRVATPENGALVQIKKGDGTAVSTVTVPNTGGYQNWQTIALIINLAQGAQTIRVTSVAAPHWNINWLELSAGVATTSSKIEAENYAAANGIDTEPTTDAGGGQNVGWIHNGDWMDYVVSVATPGIYPLNLRIAAQNSGGQLQMVGVNGNVLSTVNLPATGGYQNWQTVTTYLNLQQGAQTIRIVSSSNTNWNINWLELSDREGLASVARVGGATGEIELSQKAVKVNNTLSLQVYPNPAQNHLLIRADGMGAGHKPHLELYSIAGSLLRSATVGVAGESVSWNISDLKNGVYVIRLICKDQVIEKRFIKRS